MYTSLLGINDSVTKQYLDNKINVDSYKRFDLTQQICKEKWDEYQILKSVPVKTY